MKSPYSLLLIPLAIILIAAVAYALLSYSSIKNSDYVELLEQSAQIPEGDPAPIPSLLLLGKLSLSDEWLLDTAAEPESGSYIFFSAYHIEKKYYGIFRFDTATEEVKVFSSQYGDMGYKHYDDFNLFSGARIVFSPDESKLFFSVSPIFYFKDPIQIFDLDGNAFEHEPPPRAVHIKWFSNDSLYFEPDVAPADSGQQILNIYTGKISQTKIPAKHRFAKINPSATAYAYTEGMQVFEGQSYKCGGWFPNLVVRSYPEGEELYRMDGLHKVDYSWNFDGKLKLKYKAIESDHMQMDCDDIDWENYETKLYELPAK